MRQNPPALVALALLALFGASSRPAAQVVDSTTLRPTDVSVRIQNDPHYDGVYSASGISRICGKLDLMMPHRARSFHIDFPDDETNLAVRSVTFDADTLPAGAITNSFYLSVGIRTAQGGTPPMFVVRAREPQYHEPGVARRSGSAGTDTLRVDGTATTGTKVDVTMTIVCHPQ